MVTIVLLVSRQEYLGRVVSGLELMDCSNEDTNILAIVDGDEKLYVKTRNMVADTKFKNRLTVMSEAEGPKRNIDIQTRRKRIATAHNQAGKLIADRTQFVFSVEDDTVIPPNALKRLLALAGEKSAFGFGEGVELGRWGVPYVGAWIANDIYETTSITSVDNIYPVPLDQKPTNIDAGGLYCTLIRADIYKDHNFNSDNGLGPDVNMGLEARRKGYEGFIDWQIPCTHLFTTMNVEKKITPNGKSQVITLEKKDEKKWALAY